ncbi:MAG: hypothetical protein K2K60_03150 [Clostridia bacterium]|nr:hypothetical protein [Clostridia bacterium]
MAEEKRNRILAAVIINLIVLLAILAAVAIYQLVDIAVLKSRRNKLNSELNQYIEATEKLENSYEYYQSYDYLMDKAYEFGFVPGN